MIPASLSTACQNLTNRRLFYPASGRDFDLPVKAFYPFIDEFWFVDTQYSLGSALLEDSEFEHVSTFQTKFSGTTLHRQKGFTVGVRSDTYIHAESGREFTINKCRGRGYNLFRAAFQFPRNHLSIFFYRGDSSGEGGSEFYWLPRPILKHVCSQLEPNALLISDGSNAIKRFRRFNDHPQIKTNAESIGASFSLYSRTANCVGYMGERYGPTLAWQLIGDSDR